MPDAVLMVVLLLPTSLPEMRQAAIDKANALGIPASIAINLITVESGWRPDAVSSKGAYGLCQVTPVAAKQMGEDPASDEWKFNPHRNIDVGLRYLRWCYDNTGDWRRALYAYNWGIGNVRKWLKGKAVLPTSVQRYADRIMPKAERRQQ
jgi:soluble lytic murein transglycosylase-like protein